MSYMFIGRENELSFLEDAYTKAGGQLIFLYGRRRVGKTETLKQFCLNKPHVFYVCKECEDNLQLKDFSSKFFKEDIPAKKYVSSFDSWEQAFKATSELPYGDDKKLLIIDEFPYMCRSNGSIPSILQAVWDSELKDKNVMIILCGSAMSYIEKELLSEKNPLYGRATGIYKMEPMSFYDSIKFFPNYSIEDKIAVYSILGGIPHYLLQFNPNISLAENIKKNILTKGCILYSEVEFLLHQELRETSIYNSIIEAIALGNNKLNSITQKALIESTSKTLVYMNNLINLKIVSKRFSVDTPTKENANKNKGEYVLNDRFFQFYYSFVYQNISDLEIGDVSGIYKYVIEPNLNNFISYAFEDICKEYVQKQKFLDKLPFRYDSMGRWWGKTTVRCKDSFENKETEIDIVAFSKKENKILLGECKYKNAAFSYSEYLDLIAKFSEKKESNELYYMLFSKNGFDEKILNLAKQNKNICLVNLEQIVD